jgi:hypothetical protein
MSTTTETHSTFQIPLITCTTPHASTTMPLVVPGLMSKDGGKTEEWMNKLVGKKLGEGGSDEMVSFVFVILPFGRGMFNEVGGFLWEVG